MAGDHKCPVCQSTFTRPQHVARHMRSHTGDRPYKCQHCGDQFARSDLLSRHVNKCHASEKPPTTTAPNRRKGSAAASRATTSKQACDQCVQSSLPCDGSNPCTKCVQRKCRCTYVKFHRQTAPQGPGHPVPNALPHQSHGPLSMGSRLPDDFVLAPPPGTMSFPSMYAPNPPLGADYPLAAPASTYAQGNHPPDIMARYRAQSELLSRAGVLPNGSLSIAPSGPTMSDPTIQAMYADPSPQFSRYSMPGPTTSTGWPQSQEPQNLHSFLDEHTKQYDYDRPHRQSFPGQLGPLLTNQQGNTPFPTLPAERFGVSTGYYQRASGSEELDDFGSDGGSTGQSHSVPSSTNSSSVHLPLPEHHSDSHHDPHPQHGPAGTHHNTYPASYPSVDGSDPHAQLSNSSTAKDMHEGGFSSAFGLLSLDDPNVLAGLSADGPQFFSNLSSGYTPGANNNTSAPGSQSNLSLPTPTQDLIALLKSGGKEGGESKEMRDFWKMYMRTPLTGPGSASISSLATPTPSGNSQGFPGSVMGNGNGGRPSPTRRHSRVASLPSMKTPPLLSENGAMLQQSYRPNGNSGRPPGQGQGQQQHSDTEGAYSNARTTLHADDLKSYEQAVLARKAPFTLNLVPKRKSTLPPGATAPSIQHQQSQNQQYHTTHPPLPSAMPNKMTDLLNRPSSSGGGDIGSELAHVFGSPDPNQPSSNDESVQRATSVGSTDGGTESDSGSTHNYNTYNYRPSFKRIASQTLGPEHSKRALLGPAGWEDTEDALEEEGSRADDEDDEMDKRGSGADTRYYGAGQSAGEDKPAVSDRHRRMSCPTTARAGPARGNDSMPPPPPPSRGEPPPQRWDTVRNG